MDNTIIWALLTGLVTGGTWVGIVVFRHQRRLSRLTPELLGEVQSRLDELEHVNKRLAEVEERLDFAERLLTKEPDAGRLAPRQ
jgi:hypothetical protein